jgi:hypothetical protein
LAVLVVVVLVVQTTALTLLLRNQGLATLGLDQVIQPRLTETLMVLLLAVLLTVVAVVVLVPVVQVVAVGLGLVEITVQQPFAILVVGAVCSCIGMEVSTSILITTTLPTFVAVVTVTTFML